MEQCPFLSTYDTYIECFKECALYNYKETGCVCPFKNLTEYNINKMDNDHSSSNFMERELGFIKKSYIENQNEYL